MKKFFLLMPLLFSNVIILASAEQYHLATMGHYTLMERKPNISKTYYDKLLNSTPSPYAYSNYVRFLFNTNQFQTIVALLPKIEKTFAEDLETQLIFGQAQAETGNNTAAGTRFIELQQKHKDNAELAYLAAQAQGKSDPHKAIQIIDDFLNATPFQPRNCIFHLMKSQLYLMLNNRKEALTNVKKSLDICPRFDKGWLMLGMIHEQEGKINEAIKGYTTFLELAGPNQGVEQQLNNLLLKSKLQQNAPHTRIPYLANALSWYEHHEYEKALTAIDLALKHDPADQNAQLLKINILSAIGNIPAATELLELLINQDPSNEAWFKALHLLYKAGLSKDKAIAILQAAEKKHPQHLLATLYLADAYTRANQLPAALAYHEKALTLTNDPLLKTKIAFNMSLIHFENDNIPAMKESLDRGLQFGAIFPPFHNLLAYYYATYGRDAQRAQRYLDQALVNDGNNPHFLDTQAVIWYKQRNYAKAEQLLTKLASQQPKDFFIQLHLAKAEQKMGKQQQSAATINRALSCARTGRERALCKKTVRTFEEA